MFAKILGFDEKRIAQWRFVQAVLCWIWALEDKLDIEYFRLLTEIATQLV
ncbi:hypothetical protein KAU11_04765 [Candidatus Babeliales bacterium]|nr:hypothetical protein [Candidatus Babeliales bacterium]